VAERSGKNIDDVGWPFGTPHDLRRTYGTTMARVVPIYVLCAWMGHASLETTKDHYLVVVERDADAGRHALLSLYGGGTDAQVTRTPAPAPSPAVVNRKIGPADIIKLIGRLILGGRPWRRVGGRSVGGGGVVKDAQEHGVRLGATR